MPSAITDLARYRTARQRPITDACAWSAALEEVTTTHIRIAFAWQRMWWRAWVG